MTNSLMLLFVLISGDAVLARSPFCVGSDGTFFYCLTDRSHDRNRDGVRIVACRIPIRDSFAVTCFGVATPRSPGHISILPLRSAVTARELYVVLAPVSPDLAYGSRARIYSVSLNESGLRTLPGHAFAEAPSQWPSANPMILPEQCMSRVEKRVEVSLTTKIHSDDVSLLLAAPLTEFTQASNGYCNVLPRHDVIADNGGRLIYGLGFSNVVYVYTTVGSVAGRPIAGSGDSRSIEWSSGRKFSVSLTSEFQLARVDSPLVLVEFNGVIWECYSENDVRKLDSPKYGRYHGMVRTESRSLLVFDRVIMAISVGGDYGIKSFEPTVEYDMLRHYRGPALLKWVAKEHSSWP